MNLSQTIRHSSLIAFLMLAFVYLNFSGTPAWITDLGMMGLYVLTMSGLALFLLRKHRGRIAPLLVCGVTAGGMLAFAQVAWLLAGQFTAGSPVPGMGELGASFAVTFLLHAGAFCVFSLVGRTLLGVYWFLSTQEEAG